jgi:3',5'-cyclic-AMP phosphodiesterase
VIAGAALLGGPRIVRAESSPPPLRIAHLTDMHVQPELRAGEGYAMALESLKKLDPPPAFIVTGGDHVMESMGVMLDRAKVQWDRYQKSMQHTKLPIRSILGNHDIFGWSWPDKVPETTVGYGRAMALDQLQMKNRFYSFDAGGWKFIMLDSMSRRGDSYFGDLGGEQTEWLKGELQNSGSKPIIIFSHIPLLAACVFFDGDERFANDCWNATDKHMHRDMREILNILQPHNVKLLVSGHIHLVDRVEYRGMTFICDGAVSGNWWKGPRQQFPEGYGVLDLHADGRFEHQYVAYGWKAKPQ